MIPPLLYAGPRDFLPALARPSWLHITSPPPATCHRQPHAGPEACQQASTVSGPTPYPAIALPSPTALTSHTATHARGLLGATPTHAGRRPERTGSQQETWPPPTHVALHATPAAVLAIPLTRAPPCRPARTPSTGLHHDQTPCPPPRPRHPAMATALGGGIHCMADTPGRPAPPAGTHPSLSLSCTAAPATLSRAR